MPEKFPSVSVLVPHLKIGDQDAWNELVEKFHVGLVGKARCLMKSSGIQRRHDPEDLVQETIQKAWRQHATFRGETTAQFAKWIFTVLRNTFLDKCRPKNEELTASWIVPAAGSPTPSQVMLTSEDEAQLQACVAELKPEYRQVIVLRHMDGLKFREIAERLETETSTIAGSHRRALAELAKLMNDRTESTCIG